VHLTRGRCFVESNSVVENLKQTFATADKITANDLARIYAPDVVFVDPLGRIEGLENLSQYFSGVYRNVMSCRFDYLDECRMDGKTSIKWDMYFQHPKLAGGNEIAVRGVSLLEFSDKVRYHEDIYDVGALMYEHIPVLGGAVKWLKRRAHNVSVNSVPK